MLYMNLQNFADTIDEWIYDYKYMFFLISILYLFYMLYCFINYKINLKYMMHSIPNNNILNDEDSDFIITANLNKNQKSIEFQYDGLWIIALKKWRSKPRFIITTIDMENLKNLSKSYSHYQIIFKYQNKINISKDKKNILDYNFINTLKRDNVIYNLDNCIDLLLEILHENHNYDLDSIIEWKDSNLKLLNVWTEF